MEQCEESKVNQEKGSDELSQRIKELEVQLTRSAEEADTLRESVEKLQNQIEENATKAVVVANCNNSEEIKELKEKLQEKAKNETELRGELAQQKQVLAIVQSNEKLLEEHVASLETQIETLVSDYESKLQGSSSD